MTYISQRQYLVEVDNDAVDGYFMTKSGGNITADSNKIYSGGNKVPDIITGVAEVDNITIGRAYDSERDGAMLSTLRNQIGSFKASIIVTETDSDLSPVSNSVTYANCVLVSVTEPEYDSSSGDAAMIELEFAVPAPPATSAV